MLTPLGHPGSPVHRLDARVRVATAAAGSVVLAVSHDEKPVLVALAVAALLCAAARIPWWPLARRLVALNLFIVPACAVLAGGGPRGAQAAVLLAGKSHAILLLLTAMVSTLDPVTLGHALERLHVPRKFARLLLFTVRYLDVMHREGARMRQALRARAFRPGFNRHTLRAYGFLVGMLLVRAHERAERVAAAMKCRGFTGAFHPLRPLRMRTGDRVAAAAATIALVALAYAGWR